MRLIDADGLKEALVDRMINFEEICRDSVFNIIDNAPTVEPEKVLVANVTFDKEQVEELVEKAKADILTQIERPQGRCEECDYRKFSETFIDGVVDMMNKNGITSVEQLSEILKGGAE